MEIKLMKLLTTIFLLSLSTFSFAQNKNNVINIQPNALPSNINTEEYQTLLLVNKVQTKSDAIAQSSTKEATVTKKTEAKRIASSAKRDFENKIRLTWNVPKNSSGKTATARIFLNDNGSVQSIVVDSNDPDMKASIIVAVRDAAPFPMPSDPVARRNIRTFTSSFISK